jgi:hypothetical protein
MGDIIGAKITGELRARMDKKAADKICTIIENAICKAAEKAADFLVKF